MASKALARAAGGSPPRLHTLVRGDPKAKKAIYFLHGWPDNGETFLPLFSSVGKPPPAPEEDLSKYRCVLVSLPAEQFDEGVWNPESLTFPVMMELVAETIRANEKEPVVLVGHDWGAIVCSDLARAHPELLDRLVLMDVGAPPKNPLLMLGCGFYMGLNTLIYWMGRLSLLRGLADSINAVWIYLLCGTSKLGSSTYGPCRRSSGNFYYRHVWGFLRSGGLEEATRYIARPKLPILYLHGTGMFHSSDWEARLRSDEYPLCDAAHFNKSHWFFHQEPAPVARCIAGWLSRVATAGAKG